jgi:hypothetical protein
LEAEGGGGVEEGGGGMVEMDADGGEFAAAGVVSAEAVEAAAEFGGIGGGGRSARQVWSSSGMGQRREEVGEGFVVGAVGGVEVQEGGGGSWRGSGNQGFDFEEVAEFAVALEGAVEEAFEGIAGDVGGEEVHGVGEGVSEVGFVLPDVEGRRRRGGGGRGRTGGRRDRRLRRGRF